MSSDPFHVTRGRGGTAPKGGIYVTHKIGDVVFYKGGQYLPEAESVKDLSPKKPSGKVKTKSSLCKKTREKIEERILGSKELAAQRIAEGYLVKSECKWTQFMNVGWCYLVTCNVWEEGNWRGALFSPLYFHSEDQANEVLGMVNACYGI